MGLRNSSDQRQNSWTKSQWITVFRDLPIERKPPLLDLRSETEFVRQHVAYASNFPFSEEFGVESRLNELPAVSTQPHIAVIVDWDRFYSISTQLKCRGYPTPIHLDEKDVRDLPKSSGPSRALWAPAPIVIEELPRFYANTSRTAIDIGCGSGRDAAFLAGAGFSVTAVDRDTNLINKATQFCMRNQYHPLLPSCHLGGKVYPLVRTFGANLSEDRAFLRSHASGVMLVVRFLRRGVLDILHEGVLPGGIIVYEHFLTGCEKFGSPTKQSQMLRRGELREVFGEAHNFTVLRDEECTLDDGRPVVRFVALRHT
ncbi:hypothetical protein BWQ96_10226 [Gracilariopsis chorda]|uniref:Tellurite resistance methyltransferase TehB-like domain-containing protein n=1 Tax=Gracilariopsis chorda TaxID=448386 RepID=A0A2V3IDA0_9FLOR|nr:hypothetical protein BWQ96_10226 [Gracilariopsis chorda]|eukprot:PXF40065.1 hypothetical protein BWQ96_10226 [Gracilariopsis chorda]